MKPLAFIKQSLAVSSIFSLWPFFSLYSLYDTEEDKILQLVYEQVMSIKINGRWPCAEGKEWLQNIRLHSILLHFHRRISSSIMLNELYYMSCF